MERGRFTDENGSCGFARGTSISAAHDVRRGALVAVVLVSAVVLSACGGSGHAAARAAAAQTSIAAAVVAFVAPRDGADAVIGSQLANFAQTVQTKLLGDCMVNDGFAAPTFPTGGPPSDLGNPQFPNLPVIEATHDLGLFTGGATAFVNPQSGMSKPERTAWMARIGHCFRSTQRHAILFGSGKLGQLNSGWFNIMNQVSRSPQIRALSKKAATCSAAHGVPATSVQGLYGRLQGQLGPIGRATADSAKVQAVQAKGARILAACWTAVINETTALLSSRRAAFLTQNASALQALESQINAQVRSLGQQYGLKPALSGS